MSSCLGIYIGDKILKYAKLAYDEKNRSMRVESCGVKHVVGDKSDVIHTIISETGSDNIPIALNISNETYSTIETLKQLSKVDVAYMIDLEVYEMATKLEINDKLLMYRYLEINTNRNSSNNKVMIAACERVELDKYVKQNKIKPSGVYPLVFVLNNMVDKSNSNYMYINIDESTDIIEVENGEISDITKFPIGMGDIISEISTYCGSTAKAYDLCKSINVFTEEKGINDPEIEKIVEPKLQDILHRIEEKIKTMKVQPQKIFISGIGTLFTNVDMLFEGYFSIASEVVKPYFVKTEDGTNNISELIETTEAMALAHEYLLPSKGNINFVDGKTKKYKGIDLKNKFSGFCIGSEKLYSSMLFTDIILGIVLLLYIAFGIVYGMQTDKMSKGVSDNVSSVTNELTKVQADIDYIKENTKKYSDINSFVEETVRKIEGNEIGKYSTYNVANFMQKIIKYIPQGVQIENISSNDNKHITMIAKSESYADIGYFVSQVKLEEILINVAVEKVEHTSYVTVTLGGDLP